MKKNQKTTKKEGKLSKNSSKATKKSSQNNVETIEIQEDVNDNIDSLLSLDLQSNKSEKSNPKLYFNSGTQDAIVKFQNESNKKERDKLYVDAIMPAFEKLVENLINIYKFAGMHDTYEELKNDCVNFLFETIHKFDASLGSNAFSYFNVVAKNWLIIRTKQKMQRTKKSVSLDDPLGLSVHESLELEERSMIPSQDLLLDSFGAVENTISFMYEIRSRVKSEKELTCINAIITIFENIEDLDLLNKSAVLLYMRELSGLSQKQLATAMQSIKRHYKKTKHESNVC